MKPNAERAASDRRAGPRAFFLGLISVFVAMATLLTLPAQAGDRALIGYIGFSQDFRYFAFEEYGIQDGSGFAYANLFVVDLSSDSWVVGTPIRVRAEEEARSLGDVRAEALHRAESHIAEFGIDVPVETVALIGDGVPDHDGKSLLFGAPGYLPGAVSGRYTLNVSTFVTSATSPCIDWFGVDPEGYELRITDSGTERLVHRDGALPRSRGCPLDYRIYAVVMPHMGTTLSNAVAIISVYPGGFEGPDRRFLAVPLGL